MKQSISRLFCRASFIRRMVRDIRGTAVLEMAIMTPVLLTIGLGVLELGNLIYKRQLIENGVRDAARYVASTPDCNNIVGASIATYGTIDGPGTERIKGWSLPPGHITCPTVTPGSPLTTLNPDVSIVRIRTDVAYAALSLGFLDALAGLNANFAVATFHVRHEERFYGGR